MFGSLIFKYQMVPLYMYYNYPCSFICINCIIIWYVDILYKYLNWNLPQKIVGTHSTTKRCEMTTNTFFIYYVMSSVLCKSLATAILDQIHTSKNHEKAC